MSRHLIETSGVNSNGHPVIGMRCSTCRYFHATAWGHGTTENQARQYLWERLAEHSCRPSWWRRLLGRGSDLT